MIHLILNDIEDRVTCIEYFKKALHFYLFMVYIKILYYVSSEEVFYSYVLYLLQIGGPIFIKIGQNVANKNNINPILKKNIIKLQQENYYERTADPNYIKSKYELDSIIEKPIASGSIATIFRGIYNKKDSIIKIVHNNIVKNTIISINLFDGLRSKLNNNDLLSNFNQMVELKQIYKEVLNQTNLNNEIFNLITIKNNFSNRTFSNLVIFPEVYYFDKNIIIESYEEGLDIKTFIQKFPNKSKEASHLIHCVFYKMFFDNCIHTDMHFSNIRFRLDNDKVKIILYDFGLVSKMNDINDFKMFLNVFKKNLFAPDKNRFIELLKNLNINDEANIEKFEEDCKKYSTVHNMSNTVENLKTGKYNKNGEIDCQFSVTEVIQKCLDFALDNNLKINDYVFNICNGFILLDDYNILISEGDSIMKERYKYANDNGFLEDMKKSASEVFKKNNKQNKEENEEENEEQNEEENEEENEEQNEEHNQEHNKCVIGCNELYNCYSDQKRALV